MSKDTQKDVETKTPEEGGKTQEEPNKDFTPIESQEELDRIMTKRLARQKSKFADYDELKEKAAKFDEHEKRNKSELELLTDEKAKLEEELNAIKESNQIRDFVAAAAERTGVPAKLISGKTEEEINEFADNLMEYINQIKADKKYPTVKDNGKPAANDDSDDMTEKIQKAFRR